MVRRTNRLAAAFLPTIGREKLISEFGPRADTYQQPVLLTPSGSSSNATYNMTDKGIAWPGEAKKYRPTTYSPSDIVPPPYWRARYPDGYTADNLPDLSQDEHFQVWMRTAGLPTFRKLYFRNDDENMATGTYEVSIYMSEPHFSRARYRH
jgi:hypothetical protein